MEKTNYKLPEGNVKIGFSGGRTSGYMLHQILCANGDLPERVKVCFMNTGKEMPETLDFVQECSERWSVPIVWLEYKKDKEGVSYNIVNHNLASRNGEPFDNLITARRRLPNVFERFCTQELKIRTNKRFLKSIGWKSWTSAIGIRADESHRARTAQDKFETNWYPLNEDLVTQNDVMEFWGKQRYGFGFDLKVTKGFGNCDGCFLKSEKTLATLWKLHPDKAQWWANQEKRLFQGNDSSRQHLQRFKRHPASSYEEIGSFIKRQGDWIFDDENFLCQADDGECTG